MITVDNYAYLGMLMDNKLSIVNHIDGMYKKANSKLGILCKIQRFILEITAVRMYKTMIIALTCSIQIL